MRKQLIAFVLSFCSVVAVADELNVYIWEDFIAPELIDKWQEKTGHKVNLMFFDSDESRDEVLGSGNRKVFDLVVMDSISTQLFGKNNKIVALSPERLPSLKYIDPRWKDTCGNFGMPYLWGTLGILYNSEKVVPSPSSWGDLLKPDDKYKGHIVMLEDHMDTLAVPLLYEHKNINSEERSDLEKAFSLLKNQAQMLLGYGYALTFAKDNDKAENMYMALGFAGDDIVLNESSERAVWAYVAPEEGTVIWTDCFTVMEGSPRIALALDFLDFINQPENAALNSEKLEVATPNMEAVKYLPARILNNTAVYPSKQTLDKAQNYRIISDENLSLRNRILGAVIKYYEVK